MPRPRAPVTPEVKQKPKVPEESPSGFWPLGTERAAIVHHSINLDKSIAGTLRDSGSARYEVPPVVNDWPEQLAITRSQLDTNRQAAELFASLFLNAPVGCAILRRDGYALATNPAMHRIFASEPPRDYNIFTDHMAIELGIVHAIHRAFEGETVTLPSFWYDPRDLKNVKVTEGRRVAVSMAIFPLPDAQRHIDYVAMTYRDDTDVTLAQMYFKQQSEELEQHIASRTAELESANEELEAFSYSVSHDLRAPLRAIDGFAALLESDEQSTLSANARDSLRRIRNATTRMSDLIHDLLAFSRLGKQAITVKPVAPIQLVEQVLQELEPKLRDRAIDIRIAKLPLCHADSALLREVFLNLLDNSIKFTSKQEHARIEVGTCLQGDQLVWFVSDNGVGFDMEQYDRLFGVFSRLHSLEEFEGTGVGLALVSRIIKRHGGHIWAHGERGKGATFYFTLPNTSSG